MIVERAWPGGTCWRRNRPVRRSPLSYHPQLWPAVSLAPSLASYWRLARVLSMKMIEKLRNATEHGKEVTHRALERALESGRNLERHLRQKMRVYPRSPRVTPTNTDAHSQAPMALAEEELELELEAEFDSRRPIISVHGQDVESAEGDKPKPKSDRRIA